MAAAELTCGETWSNSGEGAARTGASGLRLILGSGRSSGGARQERWLGRTAWPRRRRGAVRRSKVGGALGFEAAARVGRYGAQGVAERVKGGEAGDLSVRAGIDALRWLER